MIVRHGTRDGKCFCGPYPTHTTLSKHAVSVLACAGPSAQAASPGAWKQQQQQQQQDEEDEEDEEEEEEDQEEGAVGEEEGEEGLAARRSRRASATKRFSYMDGVCPSCDGICVMPLVDEFMDPGLFLDSGGCGVRTKGQAFD